MNRSLADSNAADHRKAYSNTDNDHSSYSPGEVLCTTRRPNCLLSAAFWKLEYPPLTAVFATITARRQSGESGFPRHMKSVDFLSLGNLSRFLLETTFQLGGKWYKTQSYATPSWGRPLTPVSAAPSVDAACPVSFDCELGQTTAVPTWNSAEEKQ